MDPKNRLFIAIAVTVLIVGAMFTSFGRSLFVLNTPSVELPSGAGSSGGSDVSSGSQSASDPYQTVSITPETVQNVIEKTLVRSDSYYRELTIETFWTEGSSSIPVQVWVDGGWTQPEAALPGGTVRYSIVGDGQFWLWYGGDRTALSGPADGHSADLEGQRIPTYEDVLELEQDAIAAAGYEEKGGLACIYVETGEDALGYVEKYWVSVDSGLLVCAEQWKGEELTYRMTSYAVSTDRTLFGLTEFALPDGTVLHTVEE